MDTGKQVDDFCDAPSVLSRGRNANAPYSGVTMGWLLGLVTGAPLVVGARDSSRVVID